MLRAVFVLLIKAIRKTLVPFPMHAFSGQSVIQPKLLLEASVLCWGFGPIKPKPATS
jgi:hypothetical protein